MTAPADTEAIARATGRGWNDWLAVLEAIGAKELPHKEIAARVAATEGVSGWWAQAITVAYEQHIGRRVPGQDHAGRFQVGVSKSLPGTIDEALAAWSELMEGRGGIGGVDIAAGPETSRSEKWRYWRCRLADGSRVSVTISDAPHGKARLGVQHGNLAGAQAVETWRRFWKSALTGLEGSAR